MVLQIFRPPGDGELLQDCKLGDINDAISLEYEKYFCGAGTFTLELSPASVFAGVLVVNTLIYSREDGMCWIVKNIKAAADKVTVTGYDLNGLLLDRLTLPTEDGEAGTEGKDTVSGSTESCVKHFVEYNMISSEMAERNIPRLAAAENKDRGIAADSYLASKECLEDVVRTMCGGAGLGYRISLDLTQSTSEPIFIFDVLEQCDRSADQNERNRVIFSEGMRNISGIERELGVTAEKNALWCEVGGLDGFVNSGENAPAGWARREEYVSLSVTDPYNQEFVDEAAKKEMSDKFAPTDSLTVDAGNPLDYGAVYDVGSIVTVYDRKNSAQLNSAISAVTVKRTATEHTVKLTLGESKPKLLDGYAKKTDLLTKNQRAYPAVEASALGGVNSYEYLTDTSVNLNGVTYTVEKNADGLISRISDSNGNSLEPELTGEITDITTHNCVFWAAAMVRGFGSRYKLMPIMDGILGYFDAERGATQSQWANQVDGSMLPFTGSASLDNGTVTLASGNYAVFYLPYTTGDFTIYAIVKTSYDSTQNRHDCIIGSRYTNALGNWRTITSDGYASGDSFRSFICDTWDSGVSADTNGKPVPTYDSFHMVTLRQKMGNFNFFTDGIAASSTSTPDGIWGESWGLNCLASGGSAWLPSYLTAQFKFWALGNTAHSDSDIIKNQKFLMEKFL